MNQPHNKTICGLRLGTGEGGQCAGIVPLKLGLVILCVLVFRGYGAVSAGGMLVSTMIASSEKETAEAEYQIKAAFIYNFMKFTEWPAGKEPGTGPEKKAPGELPMRVGIIGKNPFGKSFIPIQEKTILEHPIEVIEFASFQEFSRSCSSVKEASEKYSQEHLAQLQSCHVLYLCDSEKPVLEVLLSLLGETGILTISDLPEFIEAGGVIGFQKKDNKIRFEVNLTESERQGLRISSQLLKLAIRVKKEQ